MNFIIMDLEWNNTYSKKRKSFFNEIIEIGAVKLDDNLTDIGHFSQVIRSQVGKKLRSSVKKLTNISEEEMKSGELFTKAFSDFKKWLGTEENTFLTWGSTDIRVLIDNFKYLSGIDTVPFIDNYCDLQKCFQKIVGGKDSMQPGLHAAADQLSISADSYSLHRALDDSLLTADIMRKIYNKNVFDSITSKCDERFYKKLFFKPKVITNIDNPIVDKSLFHYVCDKCGNECEIVDKWKYHNQFFRSTYRCEKCNIYYKVNIRFKVQFENVEIKKVSTVYTPGEDKKENSDSAEVE